MQLYIIRISYTVWGDIVYFIKRIHGEILAIAQGEMDLPPLIFRLSTIILSLHIYLEQIAKGDDQLR